MTFEKFVEKNYDFSIGCTPQSLIHAISEYHQQQQKQLADILEELLADLSMHGSIVAQDYIDRVRALANEGGENHVDQPKA